MSRLSTVLVFAGLLAVAFSAGCTDQKKKTDDMDKLADQAAMLKQCQDELARITAEKDKQIADLERDNSDLKSKLMAAGTAKEPAPAPGWKTVPGGAMVALDGTVLFDSGKAILKPDGRKKLDEVAATLASKYPGHDVYVFGHTDNEPIRHSKWKDNYELSCQRSLSVVRYLMAKGISPKSLAACGWGEHRPATANATAAERKFNRRVEIFAMAPFGNRTPQAAAARPSTP